MEVCDRCLQVTQAGLPKQRMQQEGGDKVNKDSIAYALYTLLLGSLKVMVNLTHDCSTYPSLACFMTVHTITSVQ